MECIHWRGRLSALLPRGNEVKDGRQRSGAALEPTTRTAHFGELTAQAFNATVHRGQDLVPGDVIPGPAIIEEPTTTLVVYPNTSARVTPQGHYLCEIATR